MKEIKLDPERTINLNNRRRIFKNKLIIEINRLPELENIDYKKSYNKKIKEANDYRYIYDSHDFLFDLYLAIGIIFLSILLYFFLNDIKGISFLSIVIISVILLRTLFSFLKKNKKKLILDREQGLISYPDFFLKKPIVTEFKNTVSILGGTGSYGALILKLRQTSFFTNYHINNLAPLQYWSFMVWYMDKSRPLPPGDAFDEFRQQDYKRRKAAGFPPPLYRSAVPTPEATLEQQEERNRYWRDEDYMCPLFKREPDAILFDIAIHTDWRPFQYTEEPLEEGSYNSWHRYEFEDGKIIYMRTDAKGKGYEPPVDIHHTVSVITIQKSWWEK